MDKEINEIDKLLLELKNMQSISKKQPQNSKELWELIGRGDWKEAGFESEDAMKAFILENPYANLM